MPRKGPAPRRELVGVLAIAKLLLVLTQLPLQLVHAPVDPRVRVGVVTAADYPVGGEGRIVQNARRGIAGGARL